MARKAAHLKVASTEDESPQPEPDPPKNLRDAAEASERDLMVMMRTKIATTIDAGVPPAYLAPLSRQLREIDREIRMLDEKAEQEAAEDAAASERRTWDPQAI